MRDVSSSSDTPTHATGSRNTHKFHLCSFSPQMVLQKVEPYNRKASWTAGRAAPMNPGYNYGGTLDTSKTRSSVCPPRSAPSPKVYLSCSTLQLQGFPSERVGKMTFILWLLLSDPEWVNKQAVLVANASLSHLPAAKPHAAQQWAGQPSVGLRAEQAFSAL